MSTFVAGISVKPLPGCQVLAPPFIGAAVRSYIPARDEADAMDQLLDSLQELHLQLTELDFIVDDAKADWENPDSPEARHLVQEAQTNQRVEYGEFYAWDQDGEDGEDKPT